MIGEQHGWGTFQAELMAALQSTTTATLARNIGLLEQVCLAKPRKKAGWDALCGTLGQTVVAALETVDRQKDIYDWRARPVDRAELLAALGRSLIAVHRSELLARVVAHALALPEKYPLMSAHLPALRKLRPWLKKNLKQRCAALAQWLARCREQLEARTVQAPQEPADFRRPATVGCKCADCAELKRFLHDPHEAVHRFSVREDRRKHLQMTIRQHACDLNSKTERGRSPHTLVCTKNTASYQNELKKYRQDQEDLAMIQAMDAALPR